MNHHRVVVAVDSHSKQLLLLEMKYWNYLMLPMLCTGLVATYLAMKTELYTGVCATLAVDILQVIFVYFTESILT